MFIFEINLVAIVEGSLTIKNNSSNLTRLSAYLIVFVLGAIYIFYLISLRPHTLNMPDPYDYAQIARNLYYGNGYITKTIAPISWEKLPMLPQPDFWRAPVYPLLVNLGYYWIGPSTLSSLMVSGLAFCFAGVLITAITSRFLPLSVSVLTGLLTITYPNLLKVGLTGNSESTYILLITASLLVLTWQNDHPYLIGILSALAYLTRFNYWFLFALILYAGTNRASQQKTNYLAKAVGIFVITLSPWITRSIYYTGSPLFHFHRYLLAIPHTHVSSFSVFFKFHDPEPFYFALAHPWVMLKKWLGNVFTLYQWVPNLVGTGWVLALLGMNNRFRREENRGILWYSILIFIGGFIFQGLALSFVHLQVRHMIPFLLIIPIVGASGTYLLVKSEKKTIMVLGILLLINLLNLGTAVGWVKAKSTKDYSFLKNRIPAGEKVVTNAPMVTAWYTNRVSMWAVPFKEGEKQYPDYNYVILYPTITRNNRPSESKNMKNHFLKSRLFRQRFKLQYEDQNTGVRIYKRQEPIGSKQTSRGQLPRSNGRNGTGFTLNLERSSGTIPSTTITRNVLK